MEIMKKYHHALKPLGFKSIENILEPYKPVPQWLSPSLINTIVGAMGKPVKALFCSL